MRKSEMYDRQDFDMKAYIEKRMLEITSLDERRLFKEKGVL